MDVTRAELHPLFLQQLCEQQLPGWLEFEPTTLWDSITHEIGPISSINRTKLQAVRTLVRQPEAVLDDWRLFNVTLLAIQGIQPDFQYLEPPTFQELIGGGSIMASVLSGRPYPDNVHRYAAAVAMYRNVPRLVAPFVPGDAYMTARGENAAAVADAIAYTMVLDKRLQDQLVARG